MVSGKRSLSARFRYLFANLFLETIFLISMIHKNMSDSLPSLKPSIENKVPRENLFLLINSSANILKFQSSPRSNKAATECAAVAI